MAREITEAHHAQGDAHTGPSPGQGDMATPGAPLRLYMRQKGTPATDASAEDLATKVRHLNNRASLLSKCCVQKYTITVVSPVPSWKLTLSSCSVQSTVCCAKICVNDTQPGC